MQQIIRCPGNGWGSEGGKMFPSPIPTIDDWDNIAQIEKIRREKKKTLDK